MTDTTSLAVLMRADGEIKADKPFLRVDTETGKAIRHRHRWQRRTTLAGQIGYSYVWYRCACGARRVETQDAGGSVTARRYVKPLIERTPDVHD